MAQMVKNLPAVQEIWVQSLGQEDPLEKDMATHSSFLGWRIPWTEAPGGATDHGVKRIRQDCYHLLEIVLLLLGTENIKDQEFYRNFGANSYPGPITRIMAQTGI